MHAVFILAEADHDGVELGGFFDGAYNGYAASGTKVDGWVTEEGFDRFFGNIKKFFEEYWIRGRGIGSFGRDD